MKMNSHKYIPKAIRFSVLGICTALPILGTAQIVADGAALKIVCSGNAQIVVTDLSYKNDASSTHFVAGTSKVIFNGAGSTAETINSTSGFVTEFGDLSLDRANGLLLQAPMNVTGSLFLTNGKLDIAAFNLDMQSNPIVGGSAASYIKTSSTGTLIRTVGTTTVDFPIGQGAYNPAQLSNAGTSDNFSVRVVDNVTNDGTAVGATTTEPVVNRTWMINETTPGGSTTNIRLFWNGAGEEINGFVASNAFMAQYVSSATLWDNLGGNLGTSSIESLNNSSFSAFAISSSGSFAPLAVNDQSMHEFSMSTFPNPSNGGFSIKVDGLTTYGNATLNIQDVNGRLIHSLDVNLLNSTTIVDFPNLTLSPGVYYLQLNSQGNNATVVKHVAQ
jgi:hypothetical protein